MPLYGHRHHAHSRKDSKNRRSLEAVTSPASTDHNKPRINAADDFFVDRQGDPTNVKYGSINQSAVSAYRRSGAGHILGSGSRRIDRLSTDHKAVVLTDDGLVEKRDKNTLAAASKGPSKAVRMRSERIASGVDDSGADVLFLNDSVRRKKSCAGEHYEIGSSSDDETQHYRSVQGKTKTPNQPDDEDLSYYSEASTIEREGERRPLDLDDETLDERSVLTRAVENDPSNLEKWLRLISFQDKLGRLDRASKFSKLTNAEKQGNADIKLSLYEKAIAAVISLGEKERLIMAMMVEASQIWDSTKTHSKWRNVLRDYPGSGKLWVRYLDFRLTTFSSFKYEDVVAEYLECFKALKTAQQAHKSPRDPLSPNSILLLVLRLTLFMREAGFRERAVAIWQALFERHCFKPNEYRTLEIDPDSSCQAKALSAFEEFWESEVPRIGEDGAQGWSKYALRSEEPPSPKTGVDVDSEDDPDVYRSLASLERVRSLQARYPGRTIDDVAEDDPFRVILFSDVRDIVDAVPFGLQDHTLLVEHFLTFCNLPPLYDTGVEEIARLDNRDPFLRNEMLNSWGASLTAWKIQFAAEIPKPADAIELPVSSSPFNIPITDYVVSTDTLFAVKGSWFSPIDKWLLEVTPDEGPVPRDFIHRTLKALLDVGIGGDVLAEYLLALELRLSPETSMKTAKKLIKARPTSLRLYNAHVRLECRLGKPDKATKTLSAAVNASCSMAESSQRDTIFLWQTWIWELLSLSHKKEALERLISFPDQQVTVERLMHIDDVSEELRVKPTVLLRTQQALTASRDHFLSLSLSTHSYIACELLILLAYLSSSCSLESAQSAFSAQFSVLSTRSRTTSSPHELLHQSFARLLHYHATHMPLFKPASIREALAASIALFPQNTVFLSLYAWNESRFRIDDRVRTIIQDVVLTSRTSIQHDDEMTESVTPHLFAIYSELNRSVTFGSNNNTIRNTFERAVASFAGARCAGIWKLYVLFEHRRGDKGKAKAVWWRGVRACPWVKVLWMMAFEELREEWKNEDLREIWELMGEKELRLHTDLDKLEERAK